MSDPLVAACTHALLKKCGVSDDHAVSTLLRADGMISAGTLAQSMDDETVTATKAARMHLRIAVEKMEGLAPGSLYICFPFTSVVFRWKHL